MESLTVNVKAAIKIHSVITSLIMALIEEEIMVSLTCSYIKLPPILLALIAVITPVTGENATLLPEQEHNNCNDL